ncbi:hypothetical protein [Halopiger goleimassiliensis]|uniref:hypothetical protein n=1 Tax=Halopiger goleimassiliensis TaxID=1293048 RepID=UPI000677E4FC|nr:hypothetical protein [Halopiger goleimassiliensis]
MSEHDSTPPVACTLTDERRTDRDERVRTVLAERYEDGLERDDGYTLIFDGSDEALSAVAAFVSNERRCCSFAEYAIDVSPPYDETRLTITGPEGTKAVFDGLFDHLDAAEPGE